MRNKIMSHVVAGFPSENECLELMIGMQKAGVNAIEVQIPFSDPEADGPAIMLANDIALKNGFTVKKSLELVLNAITAGVTVPIYIMTYANKFVSYGAEDLCKLAQYSGVAGFIVPDLPFDTGEHDELFKQSTKYGLVVVPVLSPGMKRGRLTMYLSDSPDLVYVTSSKGITGKNLEIHDELIDLIKEIRTKSSCQVALGFGIKTRNDIVKATRLADIAVIGSEIVRIIDKKGVKEAIKTIKQLIL